MTRRKFIQLISKALLSIGFTFPMLNNAVAKTNNHTLRFVRQIVTKDMTNSRVIVAESTNYLKNLSLVLTPIDNQNALPLKIKVDCSSLYLDNAQNYFYTARLTTIKPNTSYQYYFADENNSAVSSVYSLTAAHTKNSFNALIFADTQCGTSYDLWQENLVKAMRRHQNIDFAAILGDLVDNGESNWHWESFWSATADFFSHIPLAPVMGNHECYGLDWNFSLPRRFVHSFNLPANGSDKFKNYYYSFNYGKVHFIVLNTQMLELKNMHADLLACELDWLYADARSHNLPWQVILMHKDILAYDEYQAESNSTGGFSDVGRAFMAAFDELNIDLVLTGHMHTYRNRQRIKAFKPSTIGTTYIMSGPSGNETYTIPPDELDKKAIYQPTPPNYILLNASADRLTITDYTFNGELVDQNILTK